MPLPASTYALGCDMVCHAGSTALWASPFLPCETVVCSTRFVGRAQRTAFVSTNDSIIVTLFLQSGITLLPPPHMPVSM